MNWNKWDEMRLLSTGRTETGGGDVLKIESKSKAPTLRIKGTQINLMSCRFHKSYSPSLFALYTNFIVYWISLSLDLFVAFFLKTEFILFWIFILSKELNFKFTSFLIFLSICKFVVFFLFENVFHELFSQN